MKSFYLILLIPFLFSCASKKPASCDQFQKGKFLFRSRGEFEGISIIIERNDSTQIERGSNGSFTKLSIKWTDSCNYETRLIETNYTLPDSIKEIDKKIPFKVQILKCTNEYYTFKGKRAGSDFTRIDTLWVQK